MATENKANEENLPEKEDLLLEGYATPNKGQKSEGGCNVCNKKKRLIIGIIVIMLLLYALGLGIGLAIGFSQDDGDEDKPEEVIAEGPTGAVVTDNLACSNVGRDILNRGGTAVDAAIAALLCNGVRTPHSMGIGGGCYIVVYDKFTGKAVTIDGRETAPEHMTHEKYVNLTKKDKFNPALYVGVPGELKAYKMAHTMYGRLGWSELFDPAIKMAEEGFPLGEATDIALKRFMRFQNLSDLKRFPQLCEIFCRNTSIGDPMQTGDTVYMQKLATTLRGVAREGVNYLYRGGRVTLDMVEELNEAGAQFNRFDFEYNYNELLGNAMEYDISGMKLFTMGGASGGPVLGLINKILEGYNFTDKDISSDDSKAEMYHKVIEAMKFTFAERANLGDPVFENMTEVLAKFQSAGFAEHIRQKIDTVRTRNQTYYTDVTQGYKETMGTSHISVLSKYGDAVSVTSTINYYFGRGLVSNSTGIIWNNEMDDFSKDPTSPNKVEPGKRPLSSMCPAILVDKDGNVRMVLGASGGVRIVTSTAQVLGRLLWTNQKLNEAVDEKRFHHGLFDDTLHIEQNYPEEIKKRLEAKGHKTKTRDGYMAVVQAIKVDDNGKVEGYADQRKQPGAASYVYH